MNTKRQSVFFMDSESDSEPDAPLKAQNRTEQSYRSGESSLSRLELEIVRAQIQTIQFTPDKLCFSYGVLAVLMLSQISALWTKFIIGAAYNYQGKNSNDPKYDIRVAIPGFTYTRYSLVTGIYYSLTYGLTALFAGMLSDRFNRKTLLVIMGFLWNFTSYGNMLAYDFQMLAIMRMLFGFFSAFSTPICYSLIADYFPPQKRTFANACFTAASFLGIALSAASNILVDKIGWRFTYGICGTYGLISVLLVLLFVQEPERGRFEPKKQEVVDQTTALIQL